MSDYSNFRNKNSSHKKGQANTQNYGLNKPLWAQSPQQNYNQPFEHGNVSVQYPQHSHNIPEYSQFVSSSFQGTSQYQNDLFPRRTSNSNFQTFTANTRGSHSNAYQHFQPHFVTTHPPPDMSFPPPPLPHSSFFPPPCHSNIKSGENNQPFSNSNMMTITSLKQSNEHGINQSTSQNQDTLAFQVGDGQMNVTQKVDAKQWLQNWAADIESQVKQEKKKCKSLIKEPQLKISDIQKKLLEYVTSLKSLEAISEFLSAIEDVDEEKWITSYKHAEKLKKNVSLLKEFFSNSDNIKKIKAAVSKRREKRLQSRKSKKKNVARLQKLREDWRKKEEKIDEWLQCLQEKEKSKRSEEKMKREADSILREVRMKQDEARKMRQLLAALDRLRKLRVTKGETHGFVPSPAADAFFDKLKIEFEKVIGEQLAQYKAEEQTLRVMMEESGSAAFPGRRVTSDAVEARLRTQVREALFGPRLSTQQLGDSSSWQRSFAAADDDVEMLVKRRSDWDQFLVTEDPRSSSVPVGWVLPNPEPNSEWKLYQQTGS